MIKAKLDIQTSDPDILYASLKVESGRDIPKTKVNTYKGESNILIYIESESLNSMRAAINSYMRWINLIEDILGLIKNG